MRFKGKVSWWFYGVMAGVAAVLLSLVFVSAWAEPNPAALTVTLLTGIVVEGFCLSTVMCNFVELENEALLIVFGFIRKRIPYSDITALSPVKNPSSSLAASLDRIEIRRKNKGELMISVTDKEGFFREMKKRNLM